MSGELEISGAPSAFIPLSAEIDCEIDQLSSKSGRWRLVLSGTSDDVEVLATIARMQNSQLTMTLTEKEDAA